MVAITAAQEGGCSARAASPVPPSAASALSPRSDSVDKGEESPIGVCLVAKVAGDDAALRFRQPL